MMTTMKPVSVKRSNPFTPTRGRRSWQMLGLAVGALFAVCTAPSTGWIARMQLLTSFKPMLTDNPSQAIEVMPTTAGVEAGGQGWRLEQRELAADRHPNDVGLQVACALYQGKPEPSNGSETGQPDNPPAQEAHPLRDVVQRFPSSPMARAVYLRYACARMIFSRPELDEMQGRASNSTGSSRPLPPRFIQFRKDFLEVARQGEALAPDNAFFPMMQAVAHMEARQDAEGFADIARAARKPTWNEYTLEQIQSIWRLNDMAFGTRPSIERTAATWEFLSPHYAALRRIAELTVWQAIHQEKFGHVAAGVALRGTIMRVGALIRDHSRQLTDTYVGVAIFDAAVARPGGKKEPVIKPSDGSNTDYEHIQGARRERYARFLAAYHFPAEAAWVRSQGEINRTSRISLSPDVPERNQALVWIGGLLLLVLFSAFLLPGIAVALARYPHRFDSRPPQPLERSGVWCLVMVAGGFFSSLLMARYAMSGAAFESLAFLLLSTLGLFVLVSCAVSQSARPLLTSCIKMLGMLLGLLLFLNWQASAFDVFALAFAPGAKGEELTVVPFVCAAVAMGCVGLTLLLLMVVNWMRRVPIVVGSVRSFHAALVPILSLLLLGYVGAVFYTQRTEQRANWILTRSQENELQYAREMRIQPPPADAF